MRIAPITRSLQEFYKHQSEYRGYKKHLHNVTESALTDEKRDQVAHDQPTGVHRLDILS